MSYRFSGLWISGWLMGFGFGWILFLGLLLWIAKRLACLIDWYYCLTLFAGVCVCEGRVARVFCCGGFVCCGLGILCVGLVLFGLLVVCLDYSG